VVSRIGFNPAIVMLARNPRISFVRQGSLRISWKKYTTFSGRDSMEMYPLITMRSKQWHVNTNIFEKSESRFPSVVSPLVFVLPTKSSANQPVELIFFKFQISLASFMLIGC
jgi:hypothetical protein